MNVNLEKVREIRDHICQGCKSYIISDDKQGVITVCHIPHKRNGNICPCSVCLIKSMCTKHCDKFGLYAGTGNTSWREQKDQKVRIMDIEYQTEPVWEMKSRGLRFG